jgi:hypothetical protein
VQVEQQTLIERLEGARQDAETAEGQCAVLQKQALALQDKLVATEGSTEHLARSSEVHRVRAIGAARQVRAGLQSLRDAQVGRCRRCYGRSVMCDMRASRLCDMLGA